MQSTQRKPLWRRVLVRVAVYSAIYLFVCAFLAYKYVHPSRLSVTMEPAWVETVSIPSRAGPVPSWATPRLAAGKGGPVVFVMAFGLGGSREFWSTPMRQLSSHGYECVAPSMPGQDASPDSSVGFGPKEARMILDTVKWVRAKYTKPPKIILYGVSMGGAGVWLASEMDPSVDAVVTDGAYGRFDETMSKWLNRAIPGCTVYLRPMIWMASEMADVNPSAILPVNAAAKWRKPALVIQGSDDKLIPREQAEELARAARCPLWVVPGAAHARCFDVATKEYVRRLVELAGVVSR